jgi:hypothetical protein
MIDKILSINLVQNNVFIEESLKAELVIQKDSELEINEPLYEIKLGNETIIYSTSKLKEQLKYEINSHKDKIDDSMFMITFIGTILGLFTLTTNSPILILGCLATAIFIPSIILMLVQMRTMKKLDKVYQYVRKHSKEFLTYKKIKEDKTLENKKELLNLPTIKIII